MVGTSNTFASCALQPVSQTLLAYSSLLERKIPSKHCVTITFFDWPKSATYFKNSLCLITEVPPVAMPLDYVQDESFVTASSV